jgi:recombination protein RecA
VSSTCSGDILDLAVDDKIVDRSGSWFSYGETRLGQGRDNARKTLEENPEMMAEIRQKVLASRGFADPALQDQTEEANEEA